MECLTDASVSNTLSKKPLASFPCGLAVARVQAPNYSSESAQTYGTGSYCVVTTRDIEGDKDWQRLSKLPMVSGVAPINRLLLPHQLNSDLELRQAAASLHADILLIYTIDTSFHVQDHATPLTVVTLGLSPNQTAQVVSTASAVLIDTRNGYLYGYSESTEKGFQFTNAWTSESAVDDARKRTEARAFEKLAAGLDGTWAGIIKNYAHAEKVTAAAAGGMP